MTPVSSAWRMAFLGALAAVVACSSPVPNLYTIAPLDGSARSGGPAVILLQQIGVARYLERSQIMRSSENNRLDVLPNDWWGEPIAAMLSRVLIDELSQRLPKSTVLSENGAVTSTSDATIGLNVRRLDEDAAGRLVLQAQAAVTFKGRSEPVLRSYRFVVAPRAPDVQSEAAAVSVALGQVSPTRWHLRYSRGPGAK